MVRSDLITDPADLQPETPWSETIWAWTAEESLISHTRKPRLCPATLLPFANGRPDWDGFIHSLQWMMNTAHHYGVECVPVLNADTGYIFNLEDSLYAEVLHRFTDAFPGHPFIAGITARGAEHDSTFNASRYLPLLDIAQAYDTAEVMLMTSQRLNELEPQARCDGYHAIAEYVTRPALVHALEPAFVPWATPFGPWLLWQLARHPKFIGGKVSTLDEPHFLYWASMSSHLQLDFIPHSGDDFGLATAIKCGLPLLIGAASSAAPLVCAAIDLWLADGTPGKMFPAGHPGTFDTRVYKLFEALQSLADQVFRPEEPFNVSAYKHSTAHVLHQLGLITAPDPHPSSPDRRSPAEASRMNEALRRPRRLAQRLNIPHF
jgi:dihydrodipicolinate synthase/N-acetylneuraminate lyase